MKNTTRNTLPNLDECRRLVAAGDRSGTIDALNYLIDYRLRRQYELSHLELRWIDRAICMLNDSL